MLVAILLECLLQKKRMRIITVIIAIIACVILSNRVSVFVANTLSWSEYFNGFNVVLSELELSSKQKNYKKLKDQFELINSHIVKGLHDESDMSTLISDLLNIDTMKEMESPLGSKKGSGCEIDE